MIDFASLPWQINALLVETVITFFIAGTLLARGKDVRRTWALRISMLAWNAVIYALLFTGGSNSWQHWLYFLYVTVDTCALLFSKRDVIKIEKEGNGVHLSVLVLLHSIIAYLLIAGVR